MKFGCGTAPLPDGHNTEQSTNLAQYYHTNHAYRRTEPRCRGRREGRDLYRKHTDLRTGIPDSASDQNLQIGNLAGGVSKTVGGVVGSAGQGWSIYETQTNVI